MTSKERVRKAIAHEMPDRVPLDYTAREEITRALEDRLSLKPGESLLNRFGVDLRGARPTFRNERGLLHYADPSIEVTAEGLHIDIWGVGFRPNRTDVGFYMDLARHPLQRIERLGEIEAYAWPSPDLWDYSGVAGLARASADYFVGGHSRGIFEISWFLRGFNEFLTDLVLEPARAEAVMDHVQHYLMERTRRVLEAGEGLIDLMEYNDDVGGQQGLLISPELWRRHLKPRMAAFTALCRQHGAAVKYHSCGGVRPIIPDLIEIGVDVLNPIQTLAEGMEPEALKREFGAHITLHGGIDTQQLLPHAAPQTVRDHVRRMIACLGENGGYILGPSHVFQADVPIDNVLAIYEAALA